MQEKFPTSIDKNNNYNILFDVELLNKDEKILYYETLLEKTKSKEKKQSIKCLLEKVMEEDYG